MINPGSLFDYYGRRARLYPSLLTGLPLVATIVAWFPALADVKTSGAIVGVGAAAGLFYWLASLTRSAGKGVQKRLLSAWGGWPTTVMLRHRSSSLSGPTRDRYHSYLSCSVQGLTLPTPEEEEQDPTAADEAYVSAVAWLKEQRRGPEHNLILKENAEYGFRRNLLALKPWGIGLCLVSLISWTAAMLASAPAIPASLSSLQEPLGNLTVAQWGALAFVVLALAGWIAVVRDKWVREAGNDYARALLASCDAPELGQS